MPTLIDPANEPAGANRTASGGLARFLGIRPGELRVALLAGLFHFCLLASYYVFRPVRDEIGSAVSSDVRSQMWTSVFFVALVAVPVYSAIVARLSRRVFIPIVYTFFALNLVAFYLLLPRRAGMDADENTVTSLEVVFYVWASVFPLFVVTVLWGFMADLFTSIQGKRLFGFIAVGGTLGGMAGAALTERLVKPVGGYNLLLVSIVLLMGAIACALVLSRVQKGHESRSPAREPGDRGVSGVRETWRRMFSGMWQVLRSPYLLGIAGFILLLSFSSTFIYFEKAELAREAFADRDERTAFFAQVDLYSNALTLLLQLMVVGRLMTRVGVGFTLMTLPLLAAIGFLGLGAVTSVATIMLFEIVQRTGRYALARPSREVLFTVVNREQKYASKSFIDTAVYRGSDVISAWAFTGLFTGLSFSLAAIAYLAVVPMLAWAGLAAVLGAAQQRRAAAHVGDKVEGETSLHSAHGD